MTPVRRPGAARALATAFLVAVTAPAALVACSSDEPSGAPAQPGASEVDGGADGASQRPPVRTTVRVGEVAGGLPPAKRRRVSTRVARTVDRWWDAAFVEATYPRARYRRTFPDFTPGAAQAARRDLDQMTSRRLGRRIEELVPVRRRVVVDILATRQTARAVTARATLDYRTRGEVQRRMRVQARLYLVHREGWKVFGYDVAQGPGPGRGARSAQRQGRGTR